MNRETNTIASKSVKLEITNLAIDIKTTIEDIREYKKNAVEILRKHDQYATAKAVEEAFASLACLGQYMWERDVAISQLEELGLSLGQKVDGVYLTYDKYNELLEYKAMYEDLCK